MNDNFFFILQLMLCWCCKVITLQFLDKILSIIAMMRRLLALQVAVFNVSFRFTVIDSLCLLIGISFDSDPSGVYVKTVSLLKGYDVDSVTVDENSNLYFTDNFGGLIRKVDTNGVVTPIAGHHRSFSDGVGTNALFTSMYSIVMSLSGDLVVADYENHRIRMVTTAGVVTTLAGDGTARFVDGHGTLATFNNPNRLAVDLFGNIYVTDKLNYAIRKIDSNSDVVTIASGFTGNLRGISVDFAGNVFAATITNILRIVAGEMAVTLSGRSETGFADGVGTNAMFNGVLSLASDSKGLMYATDAGNYAIRKVNQAGRVTTLNSIRTAGYVDGAISVAQFRAFQSGMVFDKSGSIYFADVMDNFSTIRKLIFGKGLHRSDLCLLFCNLIFFRSHVQGRDIFQWSFLQVSVPRYFVQSMFICLVTVDDVS